MFLRPTLYCHSLDTASFSDFVQGCPLREIIGSMAQVRTPENVVIEIGYETRIALLMHPDIIDAVAKYPLVPGETDVLGSLVKLFTLAGQVTIVPGKIFRVTEFAPHQPAPHPGPVLSQR